LTNYYLSFKDKKGIIQNGMGDWCPPAWNRRKNPSAMECDPIISANAYFYDVLGIMEKFANMNNDPTFEQKMKGEKEDLFTAFNTEFLTIIPSTQYKWYGSQTATAMALQFGMVAESDVSAVVNGLEYNVSVIKGGHHATGIHGHRHIYSVLSNYGKKTEWGIGVLPLGTEKKIQVLWNVTRLSLQTPIFMMFWVLWRNLPK